MSIKISILPIVSYYQKKIEASLLPELELYSKVISSEKMDPSLRMAYFRRLVKLEMNTFFIVCDNFSDDNCVVNKFLNDHNLTKKDLAKVTIDDNSGEVFSVDPEEKKDKLLSFYEPNKALILSIDNVYTGHIYIWENNNFCTKGSKAYPNVNILHAFGIRTSMYEQLSKQFNSGTNGLSYIMISALLKYTTEIVPNKFCMISVFDPLDPMKHVLKQCGFTYHNDNCFYYDIINNKPPVKLTEIPQYEIELLF